MGILEIEFIGFGTNQVKCIQSDDVIKFDSNDYAECLNKNQNLIKENTQLKVLAMTCENDFWKIDHILRKFKDKDQAIANVLERIEFRSPMFNILKDKNKGVKNG